MDNDTLSNFVTNQILSAKQAEILNQKKPVARPHRDAAKSLMQHLSVAESQKKNDQAQVKTSFITGDRHCSRRSIDQLKPIMLKEMMVPKVHFGFYLLCRTINKANTIVGTMVLVEDLNGDVENLSLYNCQPLSVINDKFLPVGTIMAIKEPYLKYGSLEDSVSIRCDSPSDVIFLDEVDDILKGTKWYKSLNDSFESIKAKANEYYKAKDYENAIKYYNRGLKIQNNEALYLNRSAAYLQLNRYFDAFNDAKLALEMGANAEKALYRIGKAAYGMRGWEKAIEYFTCLKEQFPLNAEVDGELEKCKKRLDESLNGNFDLYSMFSQAFDNNVINIDVADYKGPIEIADVDGKGKGMIASRNIEKGTLLLVSKAIAFTPVDHDNKEIIFSSNLITNKVNTSTQAINLVETIQNLKNNPNRAKELYSLYAGDINRNEQIPDGVIDVSRIEKICSFNSFQADPNNNASLFEEDSMSNQHSTGLWYLPSFINHSCLGNTFRSFYGDVMVIYAIKDIKKDEEVLFPYVDPFIPYKQRVDKLEHYKFACKCDLCELDRSDPNYEHRVKLINDASRNIQSLVLLNPDDAKTLVEKIRKTYKNRTRLQLSLSLPMGTYASACQTYGQYKRAADAFIEFADLHEEVSHFVIPQPYINAAECYKYLNDMDQVRKHLDKAFETNRIKTGADKRLFKLMFDDILQECKLYDLI